MYKTLVPIHNHNKKHSLKHLELLAEQLKKTDTDMVLLTVSRVLRNNDMLQSEVENLKRTKAFLQERGIKVGIWIAPTVGYGGTGVKSPCDNDADEVYTRIKHFNVGQLYSYCPLDDGFVDDFTNTIKAFCSTGIDFVLFEDDFTISGGKSFDLGCACPKHMELYSKRLGREINETELKNSLYSGGKNEIRDVWLECISQTLSDFAAKIEKEVHKEYPNVRIGLSANSASYTLEGIEIPSLAKIIAGKNKPFIRLTGAPYWKNALSFATNIEAVRLQASWCNNEIETVSEGDTYPRPRHWVSSKHLEFYDMILQADGQTDGILKYMFDYTSRIDFETGYAQRHCRNKKHYDEINKRFRGKNAVGLRVFERTSLFPFVDFSNGFTLNRLCINSHLPTMSQEMCVDNSIPTTYSSDNSGASIAFGENGHFLTDDIMQKGVILDATSAIILHNKGVDVGFSSYRNVQSPSVEYFREEDDFVATGSDNPGIFYSFDLNEGAETISDFIIADGNLSNPTGGLDGEKYPACYYYENQNGHRFLVYSFVANSVRVKNGWFRGYFRNYLRQNQMIKQIERLQGKPLPAVCPGNPYLYLMCKKDNESMSVGLWNISPDEVIDPVITLDRSYSNIDFYNCNGRLEDNRVLLDNDILPFNFAFFTVK